MLKKIYQADFLLLPEQEFWHMYILLRKGKEFYYECAGRCTEEFPDNRGFYNYEHACFTLDGQVLSVNKKMRPSLITYIQKTIKDNQEKFRKEIEMATKTIFEKKVSQVTNELGELLKKKDHREAWTKAGELNSLLKKEEAKDLKPDLIEQLQTELRGYYYINGEIEKANKRLYAKGSKLIELATIEFTALHLIARQLCGVYNQTIDKLYIRHFEGKKSYRRTLNSHILRHRQHKCGLTHSRTRRHNDEVRPLPTRRQLIEFVEPALYAGGKSRILRRLFYTLDSSGYNFGNGDNIFFMIRLRYIEYFALRLLYQLIYVFRCIESIGLYLIRDKYHTSGEEFLGNYFGVLLYVSCRRHLLGQGGDSVHSSHIIEIFIFD